jgi:hypothetical protein
VSRGRSRRRKEGNDAVDRRSDPSEAPRASGSRRDAAAEGGDVLIGQPVRVIRAAQAIAQAPTAVSKRWKPIVVI